jgi:hypothetical protein
MKKKEQDPRVTHSCRIRESVKKKIKEKARTAKMTKSRMTETLLEKALALSEL